MRTHLPTLQGNLVALALLRATCSSEAAPPTSDYPLPTQRDRVGTYPALSKSGGGYFYDEVLKYRVWVDSEEESDNFHAFPTYEDARAFSLRTDGAEDPLVLIRQREWIDEPEPDHFIPKKGERITEWKVEWLAGSLREPSSIQDFLASPREQKR